MDIFLQSILPPHLLGLDHVQNRVATIIHPHSIVETLRVLMSHPQGLFTQLIDITAADYPAIKNRFTVSYHLLSHHFHERLIIKLQVDEKTPSPSITNVFECANWYEREVWDMFGIVFSDHADLRRILTDYDFNGHPLRKDFSVTGEVEIHYDNVNQCVSYKPLDLSKQPYRHFHLNDSWKGRREGF